MFLFVIENEYESIQTMQMNMLQKEFKKYKCKEMFYRDTKKQ